MADWVGHLAIAAGAGKTLRLMNLHVILLGALIPDIPGVVGVLSDRYLVACDAYRVILVLLPLTSVLAVVCMCLAAAALLTHSWRAFGLLLIGAGPHIILDLLQSGHVQLLAYPVSFKAFNCPWYHYGGYSQLWISVILALVMVVLRWFPLEKDIHLSMRHAWKAFIPMLVLVGVMLGNTSRLEASNVLDLNLLRGEKMVDGQSVVLISALVVNEQPLMVKKGRREMRVVWKEQIKRGQVVSIWGHIQDDQLIASKLIHDYATMKLIFSSIGVLILLLYWIEIPWLDKKDRIPLAIAINVQTLRI